MAADRPDRDWQFQLAAGCLAQDYQVQLADGRLAAHDYQF